MAERRQCIGRAEPLQRPDPEAAERCSAGASSPALPGLDRSIVLVGLMGAGKTSIGRRLAVRLGLPFVDADQEIEQAAGCTIEDFFTRFGEAAFREGERRVIARLLDESPRVIATGGGAFMDAATRTAIAERGCSIWLKADLDTLFKRVKRRGNRPLLRRGDPREVLAELMERRYPLYAEADLVVESRDGPHETVVEDAVRALATRYGEPAG
jgi:shikimate kinase